MTLLGIAAFVLVTADLARLARFYEDTLGCTPQGGEEPIGPAELRLLGLAGTGRRRRFGLGAQTVVIEQFDPPGRPYPAHGDAASPWFQHFAIVVADMQAAHGRVGGTAAISDAGPQRLPEAAGGVVAFKFRDPDGHPLELLQFPTDRTPPAWAGRRVQDRQIGLGIDHSATSVADVDAAILFYRALGLTVGARTLNHGAAQQRLDGLPDVRVDVVPMQPAAAPPHLELLGYRGTRAPAAAWPADDVAATRIVWRADAEALLRDPGQHLLQLRTEPP